MLDFGAFGAVCLLNKRKSIRLINEDEEWLRKNRSILEIKDEE
jgi:hypothetical protein